MRLHTFVVAAVVLAIGACKPSYKATDRTRSTTDTTATATDTSAMNRMAQMDSLRMDSLRMDSLRMDTINRQLPDSAAIDTSRNVPGVDSTDMQPADSLSPTPADTASARIQPSSVVETAFTTQYPDATNVEWSAFDSLAAVPIDLRLSGFKKMDADDYLVRFDFKDKNYYAWYDSEGTWIGSAYPVEDFTKLPAKVNSAVQNAIKTRYTDYNISLVNRELQKGKKAYEVELTKGDSKVRMLVTDAGKISQIFKYATD